MSLYNLTRAKKAKKTFICKKCQQSTEIKHALYHFESHTQRVIQGLQRYCGYCDQTFSMQHDASRELMYRRHVYECLSGRPCSGKLFQVMQHVVKTHHLLSPFLVNSQRAENIDKKKTPVSVDGPAAAALPVGEDGAPLLSAAAQTQYLEKIDAMNVENYWKEKKNDDRIRHSLALALGKFTNPLWNGSDNNNMHEKKNGRGRDPILDNDDDDMVNYRQLFHRLLMIVRNKLYYGRATLPPFRCTMTRQPVAVDADLLRHMQTHAGSQDVRVCCKCDARFIFISDDEQHLYLYHLLRCVLQLTAKTDPDVKAFVDLCRQGYLIDPSSQEMFDEAAFLRGDRVTALKGYRHFLAQNPQAYDWVNRDSDAMYRVLHLFPGAAASCDPLIDIQIRETLRFYDERFDAMLAYELSRRQPSALTGDDKEKTAFNCKRCAQDKQAIENNTFDGYLNTLSADCLQRYRHAFLDNAVFLSRFPPEWLIGIKQADYRERLPVEMGFYFWLPLIAKQLPYKHFSLFNRKEKQTTAIFMHMFVYMPYAKAILQVLLANDSLYYVLPYTCLCRDASLSDGNDVKEQGGDHTAASDDNVHRHVIVVFRHWFALCQFIKNTQLTALDRQRIQQQNQHRYHRAVEKKRKLSRQDEPDTADAEEKKAPIKTKYMIPILTHRHYYHAVRYVSRDKVAPGCVSTGFFANHNEKAAHLSPGDLSDEESDDKPSDAKKGSAALSPVPLDCNRCNRHFYFSIPMVYHAKPCLYLLYPDGLSDWLDESFRVKHLLYRLLRGVRQRSFVKQDRVCVDYIVRFKDVIPYLHCYVAGHGFPLKTVQHDAGYPSELEAEKACAKAGVVIVSNRIDFHHVRYFDDLHDIDVRLSPRLVGEIKGMGRLHRQLIRFNLVMYKHLKIAAEKTFWLNLRNANLSEQLKNTTDELTSAKDALCCQHRVNQRLTKRICLLDDNVIGLTALTQQKEAEIVRLQRQIAALKNALSRL